MENPNLGMLPGEEDLFGPAGIPAESPAAASGNGASQPHNNGSGQAGLPAAGVTADPRLLAARILLIDDTPAIHEDFRKILIREPVSCIDETEVSLFGSGSAAVPSGLFELDSAMQGQEGLALLQRAVAAARPYALAFVDIRMPPGWDGIETIGHLWAADPDLQVVVCTAYSDYSWADIAERFGSTDNLVILKKPFDNIEVLQVAHALVKKWYLTQEAKHRLQDLDRMVAERTKDLRSARDRLTAFSNLGQRLSAAKTTRDAALIIADVADHLLGWDSCLCGLYSAEDDAITHVLCIDTVEGHRTECQVDGHRHLPSLLARRSIREGGQLTKGALEGVCGQTDCGERRAPCASVLSVPVRNGNKVTGVLAIQSYQARNYDQSSLETLQALADHCGGAFDRLKAEEDLLKAQEQLRQSQKLEAIGQLAGGVAHDFNNLLAVIRGNAELVLMRSAHFCSDVCECLNQITAASDRAANLTRQLLAFGRKQMMRSQPVDLNEVIGNLAKMLKRIIGEDVRLQCTYAPALPFVQADVGMLEQVLVNLVVNARDAMPRGGELIISTCQIRMDVESISSHPEARLGDFVSFTVRDTGTGIAAEHLAHIFEPFFTTKEVGKGTGLGLATVYGIVKQHQGWIEVASQPGRGAAFTIFLPALAQTIPELAEPEIRALPRGGTERILLVEDDDAVRSLTRRLLEKYGYLVHEAPSGIAALDLMRRDQLPVDLLLTDVVMPEGVTGRDLAEQLRVQNPSLKVIFTSGYSGEILGHDTGFVDRLHGHFLAKPCSHEELLRAVRRCLDETWPAATPPAPRVDAANPAI